MPLIGSFTLNILITAILTYLCTVESLYRQPVKNGDILAS